MKWRQCLRGAATAARLRDDDVTALVTAISASLVGPPDRAVIERAIGEGIPRTTPYYTALDRAARHGHDSWSAAQLGVVRRAFRGLPAIIERLAVWLDTRPDDFDQWTDALTRDLDVLSNDEEPAAAPPGRYRCPRCGYTPVRSQYTTALGPRVYEARCPACRLYERPGRVEGQRDVQGQSGLAQGSRPEVG